MGVTVSMLTMLWLAQPSAGAFRGTTYQAPPGWSAVDQGELRALVAPPARQGEFLMVMLSGARPATTDLDADLRAYVAAAEATGRTLTRSAVERKAVGPNTVLLQTTKVDLPGVGQHTRLYEVVSDGRGTSFVTASYRGDGTFASHRNTLLQLLASVRPGPSPAAPQAPGPRPQPGPPPPPAAPPPPPTSTGIAYASTTSGLAGEKGFRPSGRGVPLPPARLQRTGPVGVWWNVHFNTFGGSTSLAATCFLPDGTITEMFQPGGPALVDLEGMRASGYGMYIGRYHLEGDTLTADYGRGPMSSPMEVRGTRAEPYFIWRHEEYHPGIPMTRERLVGTWQIGPQGAYTFRADGTVVTTPSLIDAQATHKQGEVLVGTWTLDGYLLGMQFPVDGPRVHYAFQGLDDAHFILDQDIFARR